VSFTISYVLIRCSLVCRGDAWHRIRHEDFRQVDLSALSVELVELLKSMLRNDPALRVDAALIRVHPVITRARVSMELAREALGSNFLSSALAGAPPGWLTSILGYPDEWDGTEDDEAMDLSQ
jgi:mitosis inhibitor protein kinase SWE1